MRWMLGVVLLAGCSPVAPDEGMPAPATPSTTGWVSLEAAKASGRPIFVFFSSGGDESCESFDANVLGDVEVAAVLKGFACVRREAFGAEGRRDAEFQRLGLGGVPSVALYVKGVAVETKEYAPERLDLLHLLEDVMERATK